MDLHFSYQVQVQCGCKSSLCKWRFLSSCSTKPLSGPSVGRIAGRCSVLAAQLCDTTLKVTKGHVLQKPRVRRRDVFSKNLTSIWIYDALQWVSDFTGNACWMLWRPSKVQLVKPQWCRWIRPDVEQWKHFHHFCHAVLGLWVSQWRKISDDGRLYNTVPPWSTLVTGSD